MKKQKENSREGITWSEMGKQNVQAEKVYYPVLTLHFRLFWKILSILVRDSCISFTSYKIWG